MDGDNEYKFGEEFTMEDFCHMDEMEAAAVAAFYLKLPFLSAALLSC